MSGYVNNVPPEIFRQFWYKGPGHRTANVFQYVMTEEDQVVNYLNLKEIIQLYTLKLIVKVEVIVIVVNLVSS